jgi:hypothetical protein
MKKRIALMLLVAVPATSIHAKTGTPALEITGTAGVEGYVLNDLGDTLLFAPVVLKYNGEMVLTTAADGSGFYNFSGLAPGTYEVGAHAMDHQDTSLAVELHSDNIRFQNITLVRVGIEIEEHRVYPSPVDIGSVTMEPIWTVTELDHVAIQTVTATIVHTPGIQTDDDGDEVFTMGTRGDVAMMTDLDGMRTRGVLDMPLQAIQEIRVYTTGIPARYGDFLGGVIQIKTRTL